MSNEQLFWNEHNLLHAELWHDYGAQELAPRPSENAALHTVVYSLLTGINYTVPLLQLYKAGKWYPCVDDSFEEEKFSHDNMTAIVTLGKIKNSFFAGEGWSSLFDRPYLHPRDIVYYAFCAGKWWSHLFIWVVILAGIISMMGEGHSGKQLAWLRFKGINNWITRWILVKYNKVFVDAFLSYYWFPEHPIRRALGVVDE